MVSTNVSNEMLYLNSIFIFNFQLHTLDGDSHLFDNDRAEKKSVKVKFLFLSNRHTLLS
jgi:hypothetical protein